MMSIAEPGWKSEKYHCLACRICSSRRSSYNFNIAITSSCLLIRFSIFFFLSSPAYEGGSDANNSYGIRGTEICYTASSKVGKPDKGAVRTSTDDCKRHRGVLYL